MSIIFLIAALIGTATVTAFIKSKGFPHPTVVPTRRSSRRDGANR
jgi:hypothetical protein